MTTDYDSDYLENQPETYIASRYASTSLPSQPKVTMTLASSWRYNPTNQTASQAPNVQNANAHEKLDQSSTT